MSEHSFIRTESRLNQQALTFTLISPHRRPSAHRLPSLLTQRVVELDPENLDRIPPLALPHDDKHYNLEKFIGRITKILLDSLTDYYFPKLYEKFN